VKEGEAIWGGRGRGRGDAGVTEDFGGRSANEVKDGKAGSCKSRPRGERMWCSQIGGEQKKTHCKRKIEL